MTPIVAKEPVKVRCLYNWGEMSSLGRAKIAFDNRLYILIGFGRGISMRSDGSRGPEQAFADVEMEVSRKGVALTDDADRSQGT